MGVSKVVYGNRTLIDLTKDTVSASVLQKGYTAHDKAGNLVTGTYEDPLIKDGDVITEPFTLQDSSGANILSSTGDAIDTAKIYVLA